MDDFADFLNATTTIYSIRNRYAHELMLPVEDSWNIVDMDRLANSLLRFFSHPHLASITFGTIGLIATNPADITTLDNSFRVRSPISNSGKRGLSGC